jgi:hypothetical protein
MYKKRIEKIETLAHDFGMIKEINKPGLRCWEALSDRCGYVITFTTNDDLEDIKTKIDALGWSEILSRTTDANSLFTTMGHNPDHKLYLNDQYNKEADLFNKDKDLTAWGWWLMDENKVSYNIEHFQIPETSNYKLDNDKLESNVMEIIVYVSGR